MKTLHLIRHAKSSWNHPGLSDVERPLNERGQRACQLMAQPILEAGCSFSHVFCSIASRAQLTIQGIAAALPGQDIRWQLVDALYTFSSDSLLQWIREQDDQLEDMVIVGHGDGKVTVRDLTNIPTCGYAQLSIPVDNWKALRPGSGKTIAFITPKMLD